jgi:hypothetical protein
MMSCGQSQSHMENTSSNYYSNNEDKFGFLVFDRQKVDNFFKEYLPLNANKDKLDSIFIKLLLADTTFPTTSIRFSKHTSSPNSSDYQLAKNVLTATSEQGGEKYFGSSVNYLFFFKSLPDQFQNKWTQTSFGDFKINVTFLNLLRTKCKVFDDHIYGNTGYWDKNIQTVFVGENLNEVTADKAKLLKDCINHNAAFNDERLQPDKDNFIFFLDRVIEEKWRLFLTDKN